MTNEEIAAKAEEIKENSENQLEIRNILLMGRTGNGKSTLGNVLIKKDDDFKEVFTESASSISVTRAISVEELPVELGIKRRIIDTIGLGDTSLKAQQVLYLLAKIATDKEVKENGINQVLFVTSGRITKEEIAAYNLLRSIIFDSGVDKFTTIIKTRFEDFEDEDKCEEDRQALLQSDNPDLVNFVARVKRILYVDNPQINISGNSSRVKQQNALNKATREESRTRLLTYLATCEGAYKSSNLEEINERVSGYMTEEEKLQKQISSLEEERIKQAKELQQKFADIQENQEKELAKVREELKNDKEKLAKEEARIKEETELKREQWKIQKAGQESLDEINRLQIEQMKQEMESQRELVALQMEKGRAGVIKWAWNGIFGW